MSIFIGIDPGVSGGIGVIRQEHSIDSAIILPTMTKAEAFKMPPTEMDIVELLRQYIPGALSEWDVFCYLEKAQAFPGSQKLITCPKCRTVMKTRQAQGVVSTGKFMEQYGTLKGILTALKIPFELIRPMQWQKAMGCLTRGDKNVSKRKAQQLFPDIKVTHAKADALLISEHCRRVRSESRSYQNA